MFHIICKIKGAPLRINGLDFVPHEDGIVTAAPVEAHVAEYFRKVTGYHVVDADAFEAEGDGDTVEADLAVERPRGQAGSTIERRKGVPRGREDRREAGGVVRP
jgi:hypothetical protein